MIVLGINGGFLDVDHDAGAALFSDGVLLAAVEEERLIRKKRAAGRPPAQSIGEVLALAGLTAADVDVVAVGWNARLLGVYEPALADDVRRMIIGAGHSVSPTVPVRFIDHHVAHGYAGLAFTPVEDRENASVLALDGGGETISGAMYTLDGAELRRQWYLPMASSLGIFYEAATVALGFDWGQEGKTMGLAAYGRPSRADAVECPPDHRMEGPVPGEAPDYAKLLKTAAKRIAEAAYGGTFVDCADIAASAQVLLEERIESYSMECASDMTLVFSGGTALNCASNGRLAMRLAKRGVRLVVPPPANDGGIALGAAAAVSAETHTLAYIANAYTGRSFSRSEISDALAGEGVTVRDSSADEISSMLVDQNAIIGWFDGAAEIGPRALGHRAVIARPDSDRVRDKVNVVKSRESWRPLAPSVTAEEFTRSFIGDESPYMLKAATVAPEARRRFAGVTHVDGTARPQVVSDGGAYHQLLTAMGKRTGTEAVVCTSFNGAGEPIVYSPIDAVRSARRMGVNTIAGDGWVATLEGHDGR